MLKIATNQRKLGRARSRKCWFWSHPLTPLGYQVQAKPSRNDGQGGRFGQPDCRHMTIVWSKD